MDILETNILNLPIESLVPNEGQIVIDGESIPANPRYITEDQYAALKKSIESDNLTGINPLKVYEYNGAYVVLGGNMRLCALRELGIANVNCIAVPNTASAEVLRKEVIIDNATFGKWDMDMLANEWDKDVLAEWGVELPSYGADVVHLLDEADFESLNDAARETTKTKQITFIFAEDDANLINDYMEKNSKQYLQERIIELCR